MIVRREGLHDGHRRRDAGGKSRRDCATLEKGERLFERGAIRVIAAGIIESGRESAVLGALESGREMNRFRDRAGGRSRPCGRHERQWFLVAIWNWFPPWQDGGD